MRPLVRLLPLVLVLLTRLAWAESLPDMLRRVAPKVVRIQYGDEPAGSGFIYPDARHVTTAYSVINRDGKPWVILSSGKPVRAKIVAWSEADDVAILACLFGCQLC